MDPAIQIVVNARVNSVKDDYMDDGALLKLKNDLLHETAGERVEASIEDGTLTASVWVLGVEYTANVDLSQTVPTVGSTFVPGHTETTSSGMSDEDKDAVMEEHLAAQQKAMDKANADHEAQLAHDAKHKKHGAKKD